jgi:probable HAF family extracellular repeat protein
MRPISRLRRLTVAPFAAIPLTVACAALLSPVPFAAPAAAATPARYTITDLGSLGTGDYSVATAVNNAGMVVGYSYATPFTPRAFRWSAGTLTDLGTEPGGSLSWAKAVNDAGQVAGIADRTAGGYGYPVRWSASGVLQDLGGPIVNRLGVGNGIDPAGRVVGGQRPADSEGNPIAILYDQAGNQTLLGNPPESLGAANGINVRGQIVGNPAFLWQNGTVAFLPGFPGSTVGETATAINVSGQIVGSAGVGFGSQATLWKGAGSAAVTDIGTVDGIQYSEAKAINAAGQVVGTADPGCSPCVAPRAWIWQAGSTITPLDTLIPGGSGWTLQQANGINDRGQIVGAGLHNGHTRAYLLTPAFSATVNFGPAGSPVPVGYRLDSGAVFGARGGGLSYGWNVDNSANTRDRNSAASPDQRYDTLVHLQKPGGAGTWEIAVPNGRYTVHAVSGDPDNTDSTYRITVEGVLAVSGTPTAGQHWVEGTVSVTVTDGRLTVTNGQGSSNDKLNYLDIIGS